MRNLLNNVTHIRVMDSELGTGGQNYNARIIDIQGYEAVRFTAGFGTVVNDAEITFLIRHADVNDTALMVASTAALDTVISDGAIIAMTDRELIIDVINPTRRFLEARLQIVAENAPIEYVTADLYSAASRPVAQGATVEASATVANPVNA